MEDKHEMSRIPVVINSKTYLLENTFYLKIQSISENVDIYGWSLEIRYVKSIKDVNDGWVTHWNRKIYGSQKSAIDASLMCGLLKDNYQCRVIALYKMTDMQFRDYKIDQLLEINSNRQNKSLNDIKSWKLIQDYNIVNTIHKKGSVFIEYGYRIIKVGTSNEKTSYLYKSILDELKLKGIVDSVELKDEKWLHPHLLNEFKIKLKDEENS